MKQIPNTEDPLVLRTDFSNQSAWDRICGLIREPVDGFRAYVEFLDRIEYEGITKEQLLQLIPEDYNHTFIIIVDQTAIAFPEHPLLIFDLSPLLLADLYMVELCRYKKMCSSCSEGSGMLT